MITARVDPPNEAWIQYKTAEACAAAAQVSRPNNSCKDSHSFECQQVVALGGVVVIFDLSSERRAPKRDFAKSLNCMLTSCALSRDATDTGAAA